MRWYKKVFSKYATFSGRARRSEYWWFVLIHIAILLILGGVVVFFIELAEALEKPELNTQENLESRNPKKQPFFARRAPWIASTVVLALYYLAAFVPWFAVTIRRLHDTNRSGWWMLVPVAPFIFLFIGGDSRANNYGAATKPRNVQPPFGQPPYYGRSPS